METDYSGQGIRIGLPGEIVVTIKPDRKSHQCRSQRTSTRPKFAFHNREQLSLTMTISNRASPFELANMRHRDTGFAFATSLTVRPNLHRRAATSSSHSRKRGPCLRQAGLVVRCCWSGGMTNSDRGAVLVSWAYENWNYWVAAGREDQLISHSHWSACGRAQRAQSGSCRALPKCRTRAF